MQISAGWLCDGQIDCSNGEDESLQVCGSSYDFFQCNQCQFDCGFQGSVLGARCIHNDMRCDGSIDCVNGSDEDECTSAQCEGAFECHGLRWHSDLSMHRLENSYNYEDAVPGLNAFIPLYEVCDGIPDCPNGADEDARWCGPDYEMSCNPCQFRCRRGKVEDGPPGYCIHASAESSQVSTLLLLTSHLAVSLPVSACDRLSLRGSPSYESRILPQCCSCVMASSTVSTVMMSPTSFVQMLKVGWLPIK